MKQIFSMAIIIAFIAGTLCSCKTDAISQNLPTSETKLLTINLKNTAKKGYLFGQHDATLYGIGWKGDKERSDVKSVCEDYPAVISFDLGRIENGGTYNLDGIAFSEIRKEIIRHYERGGLVSISWHVDNPLTGGDSWDVSNNKVVESILSGGANYKKFQEWLTSVSSFLNSLETDNNIKVPVLFRPWHEHTGSWFWWGQDLCTTEHYKELWRETIAHMTKAGVNHLIYVYSPGGDAPNYMERYPGDEYIDVLGFDSYQYNGNDGEEALKQLIRKNLAFMDDYCKKHDKLYAITEVGYECIPNPTWWTDVLHDAIGDYKPCYVLVWRNAYEKGDEHYYAPYPGQVSEENFMTFYNNPRTLFLNDINNLYKQTL